MRPFIGIFLYSFPFASALAQVAVPLDDISFARTTIGRWQVEATTEVEGRHYEGLAEPLPVVQEVRCRVQRNGIQVHLDRRGEVVIRLGGELAPDRNGEKRSFSWSQVRRLRLRGIEYESRIRQTLYFPWRFNDVPYPHVANEDVILPILQGVLEVRGGSGSPWIPVDVLIQDLMRAESIQIGHAEMVDGRVMPLSWLSVPLGGLRHALTWCQRQIESSEAYRFHRP